MKKLLQKIVFKSYIVKIQNLHDNPNPNRILNAMDIGILRQGIATDTFVGRLSMAHYKELIKMLDEAH